MVNEVAEQVVLIDGELGDVDVGRLRVGFAGGLAGSAGLDDVEVGVHELVLDVFKLVEGGHRLGGVGQTVDGLGQGDVAGEGRAAADVDVQNVVALTIVAGAVVDVALIVAVGQREDGHLLAGGFAGSLTILGGQTGFLVQEAVERAEAADGGVVVVDHLEDDAVGGIQNGVIDHEVGKAGGAVEESGLLGVDDSAVQNADIDVLGGVSHNAEDGVELGDTARAGVGSKILAGGGGHGDLAAGGLIGERTLTADGGKGRAVNMDAVVLLVDLTDDVSAVARAVSVLVIAEDLPAAVHAALVLGEDFEIGVDHIYIRLCAAVGGDDTPAAGGEVAVLNDQRGVGVQNVDGADAALDTENPRGREHHAGVGGVGVALPSLRQGVSAEGDERAVLDGDNALMVKHETRTNKAVGRDRRVGDVHHSAVVDVKGRARAGEVGGVLASRVIHEGQCAGHVHNAARALGANGGEASALDLVVKNDVGGGASAPVGVGSQRTVDDVVADVDVAGIVTVEAVVARVLGSVHRRGAFRAGGDFAGGLAGGFSGGLARSGEGDHADTEKQAEDECKCHDLGQVLHTFSPFANFFG